MRTREEFAASRRKGQEEMIAALGPVVTAAVGRFPDEEWYSALLGELMEWHSIVYADEGGAPDQWGRLVDRFLEELVRTLEKSDEPPGVSALTLWLSNYVINDATIAAASTDDEFLLMEWVTMHDSKVRETHQEADGQTVPIGERFKVGGEELRYPGEPVGDPSIWINCRCVARPTLPEDALLAYGSPQVGGESMDEPETIERPGPIPWHGVLAPEGVWSGDRRRFLPNSLRMRDLPLPLTWQKSQDAGHNGSVTVGSIERIERDGNLIKAEGFMLETPEADEVVGLVSHFGRYGVSVDADEGEFDMDEDTGQVSFSDARVCSASIVSIPAFQEAYIALGSWEDAALVASISDKPWDGSASRFTPEQWKRSCILHLDDSLDKSSHKLPIKEPGGALSRAGVHAAAARINQVQAPAEKIAAAKSALRGAYSTLKEEAPDSLKAATETVTISWNGGITDTANLTPEEMKRGPGWVTHPADTKRLHDYWTKPGEPGYAKIAWGTPNDFYRCRALVGEKIASNSPEDMRYINQICAQWHKDALGYYPGEHNSLRPEGEMADAVTLVASSVKKAPAAWFKDPQFKVGDGRLVAQVDGTYGCPLTITEEGQVFAHLAKWNTCHTGHEVCTTAPHSSAGYAYFLTGEVLTDEGTVPVGNLTIGNGHAAYGLRSDAATAHYDNTCTAFADVACGEDEFGIWVAGWVRPGTPEETVIAARASSLSGDWRRIGGRLEMVAALAVNSPGFPVPRVGVSDGRQVALVAAGCVQRDAELTGLDPSELAERVADALEARQRRREAMALLRGEFAQAGAS